MKTVSEKRIYITELRIVEGATSQKKAVFNLFYINILIETSLENNSTRLTVTN